MIKICRETGLFEIREQRLADQSRIMRTNGWLVWVRAGWKSEKEQGRTQYGRVRDWPAKDICWGHTISRS